MMFNKSYFQAIAICVLAFVQIPAVLSEKQARIFGGAAGTIDKLHYVVKVAIEQRFSCTGTLVSPIHVVTVAHCVVGVDKAKIRVEGGTDDITNARGQLVEVINIYYPKDYDMNTHYMDVALLKLIKPLTGTNISPIGLCSRAWSLRSPIQISGWGATSPTMTGHSIKLQTAQVFTIPKRTCTSIYGRNKIKKSMFCAAVPGAVDTCKGDEGSPAVIDGKLCGVATFFDGCGDKQKPGIYTNIITAKKFLNTAMKM